MPFVRASIQSNDENLYKVDFVFDDYQINNNATYRTYVLNGETWKYTDKHPEIDRSLQRDVILENLLLVSPESINEILNFEYSDGIFFNNNNVDSVDSTQANKQSSFIKNKFS